MEYYIDPVVFIVGKTGGENRAVRNLLDLFAEGATFLLLPGIVKRKPVIWMKYESGKSKLYILSFRNSKKEKCMF